MVEKRQDLADIIMEQYKFVRGQTDCEDNCQLSAYLISAVGGDFQVMHLVKRRPAAGPAVGAAAAAAGAP